MTKIAITSVGSLVGQNILDALQGRRAGIEVVGINSAADAAGIFRCDRAYLAPPAADAEQFRARLASILLEERPHLVLPGRDAGGTFRVYELNGRFTGGTNARTHLGFDEVGILIEAFAGHALPPHRSVGRLGLVTKSLSDFPVLSADIEQLRSAGHWQRVETRR